MIHADSVTASRKYSLRPKLLDVTHFLCILKNSVPYQAVSLEFEMPASSPNDEIYVRLLLYHQFRTCTKNEFKEARNQN